MNSKKLQYFLSQPHQPFFALGVVNAIILMLVFMLSYKGVVTLNLTPNNFHAYGLIFIVFTSFFQGFLLTTFPRFSQTPALEKQVYITNFTLMLIGSILFLIGSIGFSMALYLGVLFLTAAQAYTIAIFYQIYKGSPSKDLYDQFWLLVGFGSGLVANILFFMALVSQNELLFSLAKNIGLYLYLTIVALSVGQRMIPFFSHIIIEKNRQLLKIVFALFSLYIIFTLFEIKIGFIFTLGAGIFLAKEIMRWNLPYKNADAVLWILHLAIFWLPVALIIASFASIAEIIFDKSFVFIQIHLIALGFITTVLIGFGTRVTLGHSGNQMLIDKYTKILFYMTQIVVYFRAMYSFTGSSVLFDISITIWLGLFIAWSIKYLPVLLYGKRVN